MVIELNKAHILRHKTSISNEARKVVATLRKRKENKATFNIFSVPYD